jgi:hypothetical protein
MYVGAFGHLMTSLIAPVGRGFDYVAPAGSTPVPVRQFVHVSTLKRACGGYKDKKPEDRAMPGAAGSCYECRPH